MVDQRCLIGNIQTVCESFWLVNIAEVVEMYPRKG